MGQCHTLRLEVLIAFLHYTKSWVALEILGPHCNEHQNSTSDLVMSSLCRVKSVVEDVVTRVAYAIGD